jgi:hypothetical protein
MVSGEVWTRAFIGGGAVAVGLKREVEAVVRREGKMERRTEGGGMLDGGGPVGEVVWGWFGGWATGVSVDVDGAQASQSQSELGFGCVVVAFWEDVVAVGLDV